MTVLESAPDGSDPFDHDFHDALAGLRRAVEAACGAGVPLEVAAQAALMAAVTALGEEHDEMATHKLVARWCAETSGDLGSGTFGAPC